MSVRTARILVLLLVTPAVTCADGPDWYVKRSTWQETLRASLRSSDKIRCRTRSATLGLVLDRPVRGSRQSRPGQVLATLFAPETEPLDLQKSFEGEKLRWAAEPQWKDGTVNRLGTAEFAAYYVTRTITAPASCRIKVVSRQ